MAATSNLSAPGIVADQSPPAHRLDTRRRRSWKLAALHSIESALYWTGAATTFARLTAASGAIILNYHSVPSPSLARWIDPTNAMDPAMFTSQMEFLARHRHVISMTQLVAEIEAGRNPARGTVALTFDDGYLDVLEVSAPILARYSLPATIYLPTGCISREESAWIDILYCSFTTRTRHELHIPAAGLPPVRLDRKGSDTHAYRQLTSRLVSANWELRHEILGAVADQLEPAGMPPRLTMNWDEIRRLREQFPLIEIGAHTVDHVDLSSRDAVEIDRQTTEAADTLERELGVRPAHFACPYDRCTLQVRDIVERAGYRSLVASGRHPMVNASSDRLWLHRVGSTHSKTRLGYLTSGAYPRLANTLLGRA